MIFGDDIFDPSESFPDIFAVTLSVTGVTTAMGNLLIEDTTGKHKLLP